MIPCAIGINCRGEIISQIQKQIEKCQNIVYNKYKLLSLEERGTHLCMMSLPLNGATPAEAMR